MSFFNNQTVLITGSSRGIGRSCALKFAEQGANVVVNYRYRETEAKSLIEEIRSQGGQAIAIQADVSVYEDCEKLVKETLTQ